MTFVDESALQWCLSDLLVYFEEGDHCSWCVRVYWGRTLRSVVTMSRELTDTSVVWSPAAAPAELGLVLHSDERCSVSSSD